jgi:hypothetical protein
LNELGYLDTPVWGAKNIAKIINRNERQTFHLLEAGRIDATKIGSQWQSTPRRIYKSLGVELQQ